MCLTVIRPIAVGYVLVRVAPACLRLARVVFLTAAVSMLAVAAPIVAEARTMPDVNCSDVTAADAQSIYESDPSDPYNLDPDKDGQACESYVPSGAQFAVYAAAGALFVGLGALALSVRQRREGADSERLTLDARVSQLTTSLTSAADVVSDIEREVKARQELLKQLEEDAQQAREIAKLHEPEVRALTQALGGQLRLLERRSLKGSIKLSVVFYILGIVSGVLTNIFVP